MSRFPAGVVVSALVRGAQAAGGHATILKSGHKQAGSLTVQCVERGKTTAIIEQVSDLDGRLEWRDCGPQTLDNEREISEYFERKTRRDPDLWVVELAIADGKRFVANLVPSG